MAMAKGTFYQRVLTLFQAWINDYIHYKVWNEITYRFPHVNGAAVEF